MELTIRRAAGGDLGGVKALLEDAGLPILGVAEHVDSFLVAAQGQRLVGAIGLEIYGDTALLRSAVVDRSLRGTGIGTMLYSHLLDLARAQGVRRLVLLTNTAERYFGAKGFRPIDRTSLTGPVTTSVEFTDACPSHAVCMELVL